MKVSTLIVALLAGVLFGFGLAYSSMVRPEVVLSFLRFQDFGLLLVLGGAALFGIGWGLSGVCPGPAIAGLGTGNWPLLIAIAGMFAGAYTQGVLAGRDG